MEERKLIDINRIFHTFVTTIKWIFFSLIVGIIGGLIGTAFVMSVEKSNLIWDNNRWLLYFLPLSGLIIIFIYHFFDFKKPKGTNRIIDKVRAEGELPISVGPVIFISTVLTHIFGGSAGREGAAIQLGGSVGIFVGNAFKLDKKDTSLIILSGVSAVFAALFGTPLTAVIFALEGISVGVIYYSGLVPCINSALIGYGISYLIHGKGEGFNLSYIPNLDVIMIFKVVLLAALCGILSTVIVLAFSQSSKLATKLIPNPYVRIFVGGLIIIGLSMLFPSGNYNGSGTAMISRAISGDTESYAFIIKLLFTAITLGFGFKGGEIVPTFFVGSTFGCILGSLIGIDPGFAAAIGLVATFCGAVNCPLASIFLSIELFGATGIIYFAIAVAISYVCSGYYSLYSSQKIVYSKIKAEYINIDSLH